MSLTQEETKLPVGARPGFYDGRLRGVGSWFEEVDDNDSFSAKGTRP